MPFLLFFKMLQELLRAWLIGSVAIAIAESFILLYVIVHDAINLNHNRSFLKQKAKARGSGASFSAR